MLYFIQYFSNFCASFSYYVANNIKTNVFYSASDIFAYANIYIVIFLLCINPVLKKRYNFSLLNIKGYFKSKRIFIPIFLSVFSSVLKTIILSKTFQLKMQIVISQLTFHGYTMLCPYITILLCHFFLKEQKINKVFFISSLICLIGFMIFNINGLSFTNIHFIIVAFVLLNAFSDFLLKKISNVRNFEMMLFDNLMYLFIGTIIFVVAQFNEELTKKVFQIPKFSIYKLCNPDHYIAIFCVALLSFLAHNFKMISYKIKHIAVIMNLGIWFKSINAILFTYITYKTLPDKYQIIGIIIMSFAIFLYTQRKTNKTLDK